MRQSWHELLFLHWEVDSVELQRMLPERLTLDTFDGKAYVGLVPFTMSKVRPVWSPSVPPLSNFHEMNVRTYVHLEGENPGVWFFSLDAANSVAVKIARTMWKLPYFFASMSLSKVGNITHYSSSRIGPPPLPANCKLEYEVTGKINPAEVGSLEYFLTERYFLYTTNGSRLLRGQVHHTPYPLQTAQLQLLEENMLEVNGIYRAPTVPLVHYARGVNVDVFKLVTV